MLRDWRQKVGNPSTKRMKMGVFYNKSASNKVKVEHTMNRFYCHGQMKHWYWSGWVEQRPGPGGRREQLVWRSLSWRKGEESRMLAVTRAQRSQGAKWQTASNNRTENPIQEGAINPAHTPLPTPPWRLASTQKDNHIFYKKKKKKAKLFSKCQQCGWMLKKME